MKVFAFLVLAVVGFVYATAPPVCYDPEPEEGALHFPNPDDCGSFYICNSNIAILLACKNGTWFNPEAGVCDWPANVAEGVCIPPAV